MTVTKTQFHVLPIITRGYNERYTGIYEFEDSLKTVTDLKSYLLHKNSPERNIMIHGKYLLSTTAMAAPDDYIGSDLQTSWYNRNLRIYGNIANLIENPNERILMLIGGGHLPVLLHAAEAFQVMELVEISKFIFKVYETYKNIFFQSCADIFR